MHQISNFLTPLREPTAFPQTLQLVRRGLAAPAQEPNPSSRSCLQSQDYSLHKLIHVNNADDVYLDNISCRTAWQMNTSLYLKCEVSRQKLLINIKTLLSNDVVLLISWQSKTVVYYELFSGLQCNNVAFYNLHVC